MAPPLVSALVVLLALVGAAGPAAAGSHLWRFNEFYSSPDRSVQYIEMKEIGGSENETAISNHWFETSSYNADHSELLGSDLPFGTANKKFLVGSESYAALEGVPEPDYVLPDGFLDPDGDYVIWWLYQATIIPEGVMPSDGIHSITMVDETVPTYSVGVNSPTNFAGETGTVTHGLLGIPSLPPVAPAAAALLLAAVAWRVLSLRFRRERSAGT